MSNVVMPQQQLNEATLPYELVIECVKFFIYENRERINQIVLTLFPTLEWSSVDQKEKMKEAARNGADGYVTKAFKREDLKQEFNNILDIQVSEL